MEPGLILLLIFGGLTLVGAVLIGREAQRVRDRRKRERELLIQAALDRHPAGGNR